MLMRPVCAASGTAVRERAAHSAHDVGVADARRVERGGSAARARRVARAPALAARVARAQRERLPARVLPVGQREAARR